MARHDMPCKKRILILRFDRWHLLNHTVFRRKESVKDLRNMEKALSFQGFLLRMMQHMGCIPELTCYAGKDHVLCVGAEPFMNRVWLGHHNPTVEVRHHPAVDFQGKVKPLRVLCHTCVACKSDDDKAVYKITGIVPLSGD